MLVPVDASEDVLGSDKQRVSPSMGHAQRNQGHVALTRLHEHKPCGYTSSPVQTSTGSGPIDVPSLASHCDRHALSQQSSTQRQSVIGKQFSSFWQRVVTRKLLPKIQGLWEHSDVSTCVNPHLPRSILIKGLCCAGADGDGKHLILTRGCVKYEKWSLTVTQDDSLCLTDDKAHETHYTKAPLALPKLTAPLQGEWCPEGAEFCNTPHLVIEGPSWRFTGSAASVRTQGFLHSDAQRQATLLGGCKIAIMSHGALSLELQDGRCIQYSRHMQASSRVFASTLDRTPPWMGYLMHL